VLQTLTLIERAAGNEAEVVRLARAEERALRAWLFDPDGVAKRDRSSESLVTLVASIQNDIERDYGVKVEVVTVGDCPVDERVLALAGAGREAAVNAARWSGAAEVSIYAEVEPTTVWLFVRDTGTGFDPEAIAPDRQGISGSIRQRMSDAGGAATIRTAPGSGTEVSIVLPRP